MTRNIPLPSSFGVGARGFHFAPGIFHNRFTQTGAIRAGGTRLDSKMEEIGFGRAKNHQAVEDAARVQEALRQYWTARFRETSVTSQVVRTGDEPTMQMQPEDAAALFADVAANVLSEDELNLSLKILGQPPIVLSESPNGMVQSKIDEFEKAETLVTSLPDDRLVSPSVHNNDAETGIMLHCQSKEGLAGSFLGLGKPNHSESNWERTE